MLFGSFEMLNAKEIFKKNANRFLDILALLSWNSWFLPANSRFWDVVSSPFQTYSPREVGETRMTRNDEKD